MQRGSAPDLAWLRGRACDSRAQAAPPSTEVASRTGIAPSRARMRRAGHFLLAARGTCLEDSDSVHAPAVRPGALLSLLAVASLPLAACATAGVEEGGRGSETEDAGPKPTRPRPDAAGVEPVDAAPPADAAPLPDGCTVTEIDLLENGDFEAGSGVGWVESSSGMFRLVVADGDPLLPSEFVVTADEGTQFAYLGGYNMGADEIGQDVELPADTNDIRLLGSLRIDTAETSTTTAFDEAFIELQSPTGELLERLSDFSNLDDTTDAYGRFDRQVAGNFPGQTVRVEVRVTTDVSLITHFFFDSMVMQVSTCGGTR
jgi:hypothetical protein